MKRGIISLTIICAGLAIASCGTGKQATSVTSLEGEWNIVEVGGKSLTTSENGVMPTIGFDENAHRIFGNSGCNRMMGTYQTDADKPGSLSFGPIGSTRMACPDMAREQNVLTALGKVRSYKTLSCKKDKGGVCKVALCDESGKPVAVIEKPSLNISALNGEWKIIKINGMPVDKTETEPFIGFNQEEGRIYGSAGCNNMNGAFKQDEKNPLSISFDQVAATMMACPDMSVESKVLQAINAVRSFNILRNGEAELLDENGKPLLVLIKK